MNRHDVIPQATTKTIKIVLATKWLEKKNENKKVSGANSPQKSTKVHTSTNDVIRKWKWQNLRRKKT